MKIKTIGNEPLVHFVVIGVVVFLVDLMLAGDTQTNNTILVDDSVRSELIQQYSQNNGRKPSSTELENMEKLWLQTELLYREGISLGLDKNDPIIRERVIKKAEFLLKNLVKAKDPSEGQLRTWYEDRLEDYRKPARFDFEHVFVPKSMAEPENRAKSIIAEIQSGLEPLSYKNRYHVFKGRNSLGLQVLYGKEFVNDLDELKPGNWQLLRSNKGWHVVRLKTKHIQDPPSFEKVKGLLLSDWHKAQQREALDKAIAELRKQYKIEST